MPDPPKGRPEPPKPLEGDALDEWNRMLDRLERSGTLSVVDDGALYQHCRLFAETEALTEKQSEVGESIKILEENLGGLQGADLVQCFQEISKMRQLEAGYDTKIRQGRMALRQYFVEFGLTPSARSRVKLPAAPPKGKLDQFRESKRA